MSTPLPEVELYEHLVSIAGSPTELEEGIERALDASPCDKRALSLAMSEETWQAKMALLTSSLVSVSSNNERFTETSLVS